jgi:hypothetical protein
MCASFLRAKDFELIFFIKTGFGNPGAANYVLKIFDAEKATRVRQRGSVECVAV